MDFLNTSPGSSRTFCQSSTNVPLSEALRSKPCSLLSKQIASTKNVTHCCPGEEVTNYNYSSYCNYDEELIEHMTSGAPKWFAEAHWCIVRQIQGVLWD